MCISLCLWHLKQIRNTQPKTVSTSKFIGLSILPFQLATRLTSFLKTPSFKFLNPNPNMLSVQNSETWALSQADPKTKPIFHQTEPVCPKKRSLFIPKTEHVFPKNGNCFSQKRSSPKSVAGFPKVGGRFSQNR